MNAPPLQTTSCGSLPPHPAGGTPRRQLEEALRLQASLGLELLTDGEVGRGEMAAFFARGLVGFARGAPVRVFDDYTYRKPRIIAPIRWRGPITVEAWRLARSLTPLPLKANVIGPYTLVEWSFDEHYADRRSAVLDAALALRTELQALAEAGARVVQIDEPAFATCPEDSGLVIEALRALTGGIPLATVLHACYGEFAVYRHLFADLPVDELQLEMANSEADPAHLLQALPARMRFGLGVVDVQSAALEPVEVIRSRIERALDHIEPERLSINPDCGLRWLPPQIATAKLRNLVQAVRQVRLERGLDARTSA